MTADGRSTEQPERTPGAFAPLTVSNFRFYWFGLILYVLGTRAEYVTFNWLAWELTHEPLVLGYLGLTQGLPNVVLRLYGGVLADRSGRLRLLLRTQVCLVSILGLAFGLALGGLLDVLTLLVLSFVINIFRALDEPIRIALVPQLVDRHHLPNAVVLGSMPWDASRIIGPVIAGLLIATVGPALSFGFVALTTLGAVALYSRMQLPAAVPLGPARSVLRQLGEGIGYVRRTPLFATLIGLAYLNSLFGLSYIALLPIFADQYFGAGSGGYGLLQTAHGLGAVGGTLTVAFVTHRLRHRGLAILIAASSFGACLMLFSQAPTLALGGGALVLMGLSATFYLTQINTLIQQHVPEQLRGRVMSIYSLNWSLLPLGAVLASGLAAAVDARFALLVGGAVVAGTALLLATHATSRNLILMAARR